MIITGIPEHAAYVLRRLTGSGHKAYLVGGCVRDAYMGRQPHDWDVATSARTDEVARLFTKTVMTGAKFGGVTVVLGGGAFDDAAPDGAAADGAVPAEAATDGDAVAGAPPPAGAFGRSIVEVTTFRADGAYSDNRRPDSVEFVSDIEADLSRRDFTINAMAAGSDGSVIDPFGGMGDIDARVIRCVGDPLERFSEDALRMLRVFRFSAELGFSIGQDTLDAVHKVAANAKHVSAERIRVELEKIIMSQRPVVAGDVIEAGLLDRYLPGKRQQRAPQHGEQAGVLRGAQQREPLHGEQAGTLRGAQQRSPQHGEQQHAEQQRAEQQHAEQRHAEQQHAEQQRAEQARAQRLSKCLEKLTALPSESALRWCAFCAILLDLELIDSAADFLRMLRLDTRTVTCCSKALTITDIPSDKSAIKRLFAKHGVEAVRCAAASIGGADALTEVEVIIQSGECFTINDLALKGDDLIRMGYTQSREIGSILNKLLDHVIEHSDDNDPEALIKLL